MARGRMLNKSISLSQKFDQLPDDTCRLLATWIIPQLDCNGVFYADAAIVRNLIFPTRVDVTIPQVAGYLDAIQAAGLIRRFRADGRTWQYWPGFADNQTGLRAEREKTSFPLPPGNQQPAGESLPPAGSLPEDSRNGDGKESAESESESESESEIMGAEKPAPEKPGIDFTPEFELEMLLGSQRRTSVQAEQDMARANWDVQPDEVRWAIACFLSASALPVPGKESARKDWYVSCKEQQEAYGLVALQKYYPPAIKQLRDDHMIVARPGALDKVLADLVARTAPELPPPKPDLHKFAIPPDVLAQEEARLAPH